MHPNCFILHLLSATTEDCLGSVLANFFTTFLIVIMTRDVVLEASASARGSFLAGSASPRPHTVLPLSCLGLDLTASASALPHSFCLGLGSVLKVAPCLGSVVSVNLRQHPPTELKFNVTHRDFAYF